MQFDQIELECKLKLKNWNKSELHANKPKTCNFCLFSLWKVPKKEMMMMMIKNRVERKDCFRFINRSLSIAMRGRTEKMLTVCTQTKWSVLKNVDQVKGNKKESVLFFLTLPVIIPNWSSSCFFRFVVA